MTFDLTSLILVGGVNLTTLFFRSTWMAEVGSFSFSFDVRMEIFLSYEISMIFFASICENHFFLLFDSVEHIQ
jgi:hypothetical protein